MPTSAQSPRTVERFVIGQARAVVRHVIVPGETAGDFSSADFAEEDFATSSPAGGDFAAPDFTPSDFKTTP
jgi:hypothetical protein